MRPARASEVIVVGGGVVGLCSSLLLARDGYRVRLLERDPAGPPPRDQDPWGRWERRGVNQFQLRSRQTELLGSTASPTSPTR